MATDITSTDRSDPKRDVKLGGADKTARIPIKVVPPQEKLRKPKWVRAKLPSRKFFRIKDILHEQKMRTVCEKVSCLDTDECFSKGMATFMITDNICI